MSRWFLQVLVGSFNAVLGLARIGDVQSVQRPAKVRHAIVAENAALVDTKHAILVAVKRYRLTPSFKVSCGPCNVSHRDFCAGPTVTSHSRWKQS
jgi:hypothetical protein